MHDDRRHEDVGCPVVGLADQQPGLDREGDVEHRLVGVAHVKAAQRRVGAVVDLLGGAGVEEERQIDAGGHQHDERVQGDLAEQERPVVGEQVAQRLAQQRRRAAALVQEANRPADHVERGLRVRTPQKEGPTGPEKFPAARS